MSPTSLKDRLQRLDRRLLIGGGVVVVLLLLLALARGGGSEYQHISAKVKVGDIKDVVEATGTVNAVVTVQVGSQVSGTIAKMNVDFNSRVKKDEIIAEIEPSLLQGAVSQASADLESARAGVVAAEANLTRAKAQVVQTKADFDRISLLAQNGNETQQNLETATANYETAKAAVAVADAGVTQAQAQVSQKAAALQVARTNLDHTVIRSPIDGIVVARNVDVGQTVAASLQAPTLFTIAQDLREMQVYTKVDESDVGHIRAGQPVTFKVDAFPDESFKGAVSQVRMNPAMVQNVVTYDAIIGFANPDLKLFPGMTAYVTIPVATADSVLSIPNAALRYRAPMSPGEVQALYKKYGIPASDSGRPGMRKSSGDSTSGAGAQDDQAIVWKLHADGTIEPVKVQLGITDHAFTQVVRVLKGSLTDGDDVVTRSLNARTGSPVGAGGAGGGRGR